MGSSMSLTGVVGALRWGYHPAGALRDWAIVGGNGKRTLTATVVSKDDFKVTQRPLKFVVTHEKGSWVWPIESLEIAGTALTAQLGPKEPT